MLIFLFVKIWMVYPNILPPSVVENASSSATTSDTTRPTPHLPRIEYLSTLSRHSAPVNVVRFSPSGMSCCVRSPVRCGC